MPELLPLGYITSTCTSQSPKDFSLMRSAPPADFSSTSAAPSPPPSPVPTSFFGSDGSMATFDATFHFSFALASRVFQPARSLPLNSEAPAAAAFSASPSAAAAKAGASARERAHARSEATRRRVLCGLVMSESLSRGAWAGKREPVRPRGAECAKTLKNRHAAKEDRERRMALSALPAFLASWRFFASLALLGVLAQIPSPADRDHLLAAEQRDELRHPVPRPLQRGRLAIRGRHVFVA